MTDTRVEAACTSINASGDPRKNRPVMPEFILNLVAEAIRLQRPGINRRPAAPWCSRDVLVSPLRRLPAYVDTLAVLNHARCIPPVGKDHGWRSTLPQPMDPPSNALGAINVMLAGTHGRFSAA
jgi:hypothetical protein